MYSLKSLLLGGHETYTLKKIKNRLKFLIISDGFYLFNSSFPCVHWPYGSTLKHAVKSGL